MTALRTERDELAAEHLRTQDELAEARRELAEARRELAEARRELAEARRAFAAMETSRAEVARRAAVCKESLDRTMGEVSMLSRENAELQRTLTAAQEAKQVLATQCARANAEVNRLEEEVDRGHIANGILQYVLEEIPTYLGINEFDPEHADDFIAAVERFADKKEQAAREIAAKCAEEIDRQAASHVWAGLLVSAVKCGQDLARVEARLKRHPKLFQETLEEVNSEIRARLQQSGVVLPRSTITVTAR